MNEQHRRRQLAHIESAIAEADKVHTPEELAQAAHDLQRELDQARGAIQPQLPLRAA